MTRLPFARFVCASAILAVPLLAEDWEGGVAGVTASYVKTEDRSSAISILALPIGPPLVDTNRGDGPALGGLVGYRKDLAGFILGAELDADWTDSKFGRNEAAGSTSTHIRWQSSLRAVAGVPAGQALIFATGGLGAADTAHDAQFGLGAPLFRWSRTSIGWVAGGGVELATGKIHPRLEYRHADYGQTVTEVDSTIIFRRRVRSDSIRLSAILRF